MKKFFVTVGVAVISVALVASAAFATSIADVRHWIPHFVTPTHPQRMSAQTLARLAAAGARIPFWRSTVKSPLDGKTYGIEMVGSSPLATPATTTVAFVPIVVKVKFADGSFLDPTKPGCGDRISVQSRFFKSPFLRPSR